MSIDHIPTFEVLTIDVDDPLASVFSKYTDVFGIKTYATSAVDDLKLIHASTILAEYLDNNEDGVVDSRLVVQSMNNINATMVMFKNELEQEESALDQINVQNIRFQNLWDTETPCEALNPPKLCLFIAPAKPLPIDLDVTSTY